MERAEQDALLSLGTATIRFATHHPYAATGIFGAAIGSAATYAVMTSKTFREKVNGVFTPKVYQLELTHEDLRRMLVDPAVEIRLETTEMTVVVSVEKREPLRALPDIVVE